MQIKENLWLSDILRPNHIVFRSTSLVAQSVSALTGHGIAMLPSFVAASNEKLIAVMPELFTMRDIWISVHEDLLHISRIRAVIKFLEQRIESDRELLTSSGGAKRCQAEGEKLMSSHRPRRKLAGKPISASPGL